MKVIDQEHGNGWAAYHGDSCEVLRGIPNNSIDYVIYSPPFASLYVYSNSIRDLGNVRDEEEFSEQYKFIVRELYRVLKPGRLASVHCMTLPATKQHHGYIGLTDFRGELIRLHQSANQVLDGANWYDHNFIYHSEVCIWKDPVTAMQRTKSLGLLYKQLKKDSTRSRQGVPDYLVTFRKPGENTDPVRKTEDLGEVHMSVDEWQEYASPVWMDINPSRTLQYTSAREQSDERHICPLQLDVIERALRLWTNPNDIVLSPFAGIGSEVVTAVQMGRRAIGIELKASYYKQAVANLRIAEANAGRRTLFDLAEDAA